MPSLTDINATSAQIQLYVASDNPASQQEDMAAVAELLGPLTPAEITQVTQSTLLDLTVDDKGDLFKELAQTLDAEQLAGVAGGLYDPAAHPNVVNNEINDSHLADLGDLCNAVNLFSTPEVRYTFGQVMQRRSPWQDLNDAPPRQSSGDPATDARQAFIEQQLSPEKRDNPRWEYRLFMKNPLVMAQPIINAHYRAFPDGPVQLEGATQVANAVSLALGYPLAVAVDPNDPAKAQAQMHSEDLFGAGMSADQLQQRENIAEKILALGGNAPRVTFIPVVYAIDNAKGGVIKSDLFKVEGANGEPARFVDDQGLDYASFAEYRKNNNLPAQGVVLARPRGTEVSRDAQGNVQLYAVDARIEGGVEEARRVLKLDQAALGLGTGAALVMTAGQLGWLAPASTLLLAADGAALGTVAYGTVLSGSRVAQRVRFGDNMNPIENPAFALDVAGTVLGVAGAGQMLTRGLGNTLVNLANREASLASSAGAAGNTLQASAHAASQQLLMSQSQLPLAVGKAVFTPKVNAGLMAGELGMLGVTTHETVRTWDQLTPAQAVEQLLTAGVGALGFGVAAKAYLSSRATPAFTETTPDPVRASTPAPTITAPLRSVALPDADIMLSGTQIRNFDVPGPGLGVAAAPGLERKAVWYKPGELPDGVARAYADLIQQQNPGVDLAQALAGLGGKNVVVVSEGLPGGTQKIVGAAGIDTQWGGSRTLQVAGQDTGIRVRRGPNGDPIKRGDAYVSDVVGVNGGDANAVQAILSGAKDQTDVRRVLWSTSDAAAQARYGTDLPAEFPGVRPLSKTLQRGAPELVSAIPADQRTPGQAAALAQPTRRQQLLALSDLTNLPDGVREVTYELPIKRPLSVAQKIANITDPESYLGQANAFVNPVGRVVGAVQAVQKWLAKPVVVATFPGEGTGPERVATMYPPGTMTPEQALEQAQRVIDANKSLPGSPYASASVGEVAKDLNSRYVVRVTETILDAGGQPITQLVGGGSVKPRWAGSTGDGQWLGGELPRDASYLAHIFGAKGGGGQATEACMITAGLLGSSELDFYTRWPGAQALYAKLNVPIVDSVFTPEAPILLLKGDPAMLANLPNRVRAAVVEAKMLPPGEQHAALGAALKDIEKLDFQTTFSSAQKLYASLMGPNRKAGFAPTAADTLLKADPAVVDALPPSIRDAVVSAKSLPLEERSPALTQALAAVNPAAAPMLSLPDGVLRLSYRQPIEVGENWAREWKNAAWKWTREAPPFRLILEGAGSLLGRPVNPVEVATFSKQGSTAGVDRRATLYPPGTLSKEDLLEQARLVLAANGALPNSPYARSTTAQLAEQLNDLYVIQVRDNAGKLLGGSAVQPDWQGPLKDGRWLDSSLPKNTSYLSHVFGGRGAGEQATAAAQVAAGGLLLSDDMAFYTRWQAAQGLYKRMDSPIADVRFTPLAPDILLAAGPAMFEQLPSDFQQAITIAKAYPPAEARANLQEWLEAQKPETLTTQLPNGVLRASYMVPLQASKTGAQTLAQRTRDFVDDSVMPMVRGASGVAERVNETLNPYGGPENLQPGEARQSLRDMGYLVSDAKSAAVKWGGGALALTSAAQLATGEAVLHEDDDRATAPFNALPGSSSYSLNFPWTSTTLSVWGSPMALRGVIGIGDTPGMPMGRMGPPPGNPAGPSSTTVVVPARANLGEIGAGLQVGTNDYALRATAVARLGNAAFNVRADYPNAPGAAKGVSLLSSFTTFQPSTTLGAYAGRVGVMERGMQLVLGPALQWVPLSRDAAGKASVVFAGDRGSIGGKLSGSQGLFFTLNPVYGKPEPDWTPVAQAADR